MESTKNQKARDLLPINKTRSFIGHAYKAGIENSEICQFYQKNWIRPIALSRMDFLAWQMNSAPEANENNHSIVAIADGELLGVMGCTPMPFVLNSKVLQGAALTTWVVSNKARGKGLAKLMLEYLKNSYEVLAGAGITKSALSHYFRADFSFLAYIPRFFFITDFESSRKFTKISEKAQKITQNRQNFIGQHEFVSSKVTAMELGGLMKRNQPQLCFERNPAQLKWRYDDHPCLNYEAFIIRDKMRPGDGAGVIIRQDRVENSSFIHIVELFGDTTDFPATFSFLEDIAAKRGVAFIDISVTSSVVLDTLRLRNWSSVMDDPFIQMPSLFYPIELRTPPTSSLVIWGKDRKAIISNFSKLYFSKGDLDLDRPTLDYYERNRK